MKKILSVLLAMLLIFALGVSAMALTSPGAKEHNNVVINRTNTGESSSVAETKTVVDGEDITITPVKNEKIEFNGWEIFTDATAKEAAEEGTDYELVSVKKEDGSEAQEGTDYKVENGKIVAINGDFLSITIKPITDLYVSEAYEGVDIEFNVTSPVTGESASSNVAVWALVAVMAVSAAVAFSTKRAFN